MNCNQFQEIVHDLARYDGLDSAVRRDALAHADSCAHCDELLAEAQSLTSALHSLAAKDAALGASERVEAAVRKAFRETLTPAVHSNRAWQWGFAGAASLAALVLLSVLVLRHPVVSPPTRGHGADASTASLTATPQSAGASNQPGASNSSAGDLNSSLADADSVYATSFVQIPFTDETSPVGDEVIVRESFSPSALANLGLPVSDAASGGNVLVDVVVDEDGTPRAIRIVE